MVRRNRNGMIVGALALGIAAGGIALAQAPAEGEPPAPKPPPRAGQAKADRAAVPAAFQVKRQPLMKVISGWPDASQKVARTMIEKYGLPDEATPSLLVWYDNGPWKRTVVYKEPVDHNFPIPHQDVVEQFVNYKIPSPDLADELATYDGSVYLDRTRGELSAKCDQEGANILALNLADDLMKGEKTVDEARQAYGDAIKQAMTGKPPAIMTSLQFEPPSAEAAGDPDRAIIEPPVAGRGAQEQGEAQEPARRK